MTNLSCINIINNNRVANFTTQYYYPKTRANFNSNGNHFSTECKISVRKSKGEISLRLDRQHSSHVLAKRGTKL